MICDTLALWLIYYMNIVVETVRCLWYALYMIKTFQKLTVRLLSGKSFAELRNLWRMFH